MAICPQATVGLRGKAVPVWLIHFASRCQEACLPLTATGDAEALTPDNIQK